mgnify:CR=1 FL=1
MTERILIKVREDLCSGCLSCMTTCSMVNELYASLSGSRVQVELSPFEGEHKIVICKQCTKAFCAEACPENAISRHPDGYLVVDYELCTACKACIEACPFDAMFWNPISEKVIKCEMCGGNPQCVEACPTGTLTVQRIPVKRKEPA